MSVNSREKYGKYGNHWEWMGDIYGYIWDINGEFMGKITFCSNK